MIPGSIEERIGDAAFVRASLYRTSVLASLCDWPKTTGQVASACSLSMAHASRTIRELIDRNLAMSATPEVRGRGRLYALTPAGERLFLSLESEQRRPIMVPMARGNHAHAMFRALTTRVGQQKARTLFTDRVLLLALESPKEKWVPLRSLLDLLEDIELNFGDGTHRIVRELAAEAITYFPSVRRYVMRAFPIRIIADFSPAAYLREFNHGRMEADVNGNVVHFKHYDWLSSLARCAAWHGTYEGVFRMRKVPAEIVKSECILRGDEFCGYLATYRE